MFGAAASAIEGAGASVWPVDRADYDRNVAYARARRGEEAFAAAFATGRGLSIEQAVTEATALAAELTEGVATTQAAGLTPREVDVVRLLARRHTDKEIAAALSLSPRTVMHHVSSVLAKLGVATRREAADWASRHGLD